LPQTLQLIWAATARWTALWLVLLFFQGLLPAIAVYLTKSVVDGLLKAIASSAGLSATDSLLKPAAALATVMVLQVLVGGIIGWVRFLQSEILQDYISRKIHEKSVSVKMSFYDLPEYYDHLHRARDEASHRPAALLEVTGGLLQNTVTSVGVAAVLLPYGVWLPMALFLGSIPSLGLVLQNSLRRQEWNRRSTPQIRTTWYLEHLLTARETAAEVRIFDLGAHFIEAYQTLRQGLRREQSYLVRREAAGELLAALLGMMVGACACGWVVWQAIQGRMTAGALAMFFAAFVQAQALMRSLLQKAGELYTNSLFLGNLFQFLALEAEPARRAGPLPTSTRSLRFGVQFESVDFTYPGTSTKALADFSLDVPAGQTVAIVGPNGAGKSTIVKLLCRFYDPQRGRISIDGADVRERPAAEIRQLVSVLLQEPVRYAMTAAENVGPDSSFHVGRQAIDSAVRAAAAEGIIDRLPHGYDTLLGKWFDDGVELSAGQWQRIALARAFFRDAPILLLDEPTSAMDSWAEAGWFDRFQEAAGARRTTIIITHRFTTAMRADVIHVMQNGRIVESGSHEKLLALDGQYACSWTRQTRELPRSVRLITCPRYPANSSLSVAAANARPGR
jgi:ATP-binding cassette subfamily B protein